MQYRWSRGPTRGRSLRGESNHPSTALRTGAGLRLPDMMEATILRLRSGQALGCGYRPKRRPGRRNASAIVAMTPITADARVSQSSAVMPYVNFSSIGPGWGSSRM